MLVENFLSFSKASFDFCDQGLVLVEGENKDDASAKSNGSGKSAMIDALVWCLFGTTLRGYQNDDVVNRRVGDDCLVTVTLERDEETIVVARARRHSKLKNSLRVSDAHEDRSGPSNAETQELVEEILGCSMRTFLSSVVFGQDSAYRFSSLTDKEQKEILDEVLGVERFAVACNAARGRASVTATSVGIIRRDLEMVESARDVAESEVDDLREKDGAYEGERARKVAEEREKLKRAKDQLKKALKVDVDKLRSTIDKAQKQVGAQERVLDDLLDGLRRAQSALDVARSKHDDVAKLVSKHENLAGDCPTCGQAIDALQHDRVLGDYKKRLAASDKAVTTAEGTAAEIADAVRDSRRKVADLRKTAQDAQKQVNDNVAEAAQVSAAQQRVKAAEERIAELEAETSPYAALAKKAKSRHEKHVKEAELLTSQLASEDAQLKLTEFWVEAFGAKGLRSLLLDSSLPLLNEEAARISRAVTGGSVSVEFSATSELKSGKTVDKFEVRVDNKHGAASYLGNSSGERAKVDLCVGLALQRLVASRSSASFNLVMFDEVFDHLDSAAHERVIEVLSEIDKESVFVVSHDEDLKAFFPHVLTIRKKNGFSTVVKQ